MKDKPYTVEQEQIARFAKAMGHPARMAILAFLANQESCFFGDIHEVLPIAKATVSQISVFGCKTSPVRQHYKLKSMQKGLQVIP